jgi:hypothetical protein
VTDTTTPASRAIKHQRQERWRERNPQAYWAHAALRSGLRRGLVQPQPCEVCGETKAEAHHPDYDRPLMVQWLCRVHHKQVHAQERAKA